MNKSNKNPVYVDFVIWATITPEQVNFLGVSTFHSGARAPAISVANFCRQLGFLF